jgi:hypothetical protein
MFRRQNRKAFSAIIKRQALAKRFPISEDELTKLAQEAAASAKVTVCPPGEHPSVVEQKRAARAHRPAKMPKPPVTTPDQQVGVEDE